DAARREDQERRGQFDDQDQRRGTVAEPCGKFLRVPGEDERERLRVVVEIQRGEAAPARIAAEQFDASGQKIQTKYQPAEQPDHYARTAEKDREKAGFEQQSIPLKRKKVLSGRAERKIQEK